eukprot:gnl/TRDRNA2_/TRDRNA2_90476_c1_seq1.p1 gnl/TRDRNA2_/TRDRNA2_90476_c1~~gnl/TRDRNA2_/TRDRNA2_90476_c1_seq1.p1  ORF type:complete len:183 (+),score=45.50 gnl/TRDRNA2_/TRDRNA2_90476_c1_seq1:83-631(+)
MHFSYPEGNRTNEPRTEKLKKFQVWSENGRKLGSEWELENGELRHYEVAKITPLQDLPPVGPSPREVAFREGYVAALENIADEDYEVAKITPLQDLPPVGPSPREVAFREGYVAALENIADEDYEQDDNDMHRPMINEENVDMFMVEGPVEIPARFEFFEIFVFDLFGIPLGELAIFSDFTT